MNHKSISVLSLLVFGAAAAYPQIDLNSVPERAVGTPALTVTNANPNLVAGREFYSPQAVALDTSVSPPILYVSDYGNNRVLAWKNSAGFASGQTADLAIGQPDLFTTFPEGPAVSTSNYTSGLYHPSGVAVDSKGNLYVADGGNNRVLRYPKPFAQTTQFPVPDLFIGQGSVSGHIANYPAGTAVPTAQGIYLNNGSAVLISNLAFDSSGNLWVTDTGNSRILRFNATVLAGTGGGIAADMELGQLTLTSNNPSALNPGSATSYYVLNQFIAPSALAFDPSGNLFVGDYNRALVFVPPFSSGMSASSHILGIFPVGYTYPTTAAAYQALIDQTDIFSPTAFFFLSGSASGVGVVDATYNRIMIFPTFANWPSTGTPPQATTILGQPNLCTQSPNQSCKAPNNGSLPGPSSSVFATPAGVAYTGTDLYLADAGNNRVLDLPQTGGASIFGQATRVLGQDYFYENSPNLIEGREFQFTGIVNNSAFEDSGMAIDDSTGIPHLYVSDPYNNRVLGFYDLRKFQNGAQNKADIVLGQADFTTAMINYPTGDPNQPSQTNLYRPVGLLVDTNGNLYVADSFNGRVLRFPAPFAYAGLEHRAGVNTGAAPEPADLVLGQQNFTSKITDPTANSMAAPYGLAFTPSCDVLNPPCAAPNGLVVSDQADNRVLYIPATNGTFVAGNDNGKAATVVFGQTSFNNVTTGSSTSTMNSPHHVSSDTVGYVYVADTANNRVMIFDAAGAPPEGAQAAAIITGLSGPEGVFVNPHTLEIWVANTGSGTSLRYANETSVLLGLGTTSNIAEVSGSFQYSPLAVAEDQYGDLFVADSAHRVALYVPGLNVQNDGNYELATSTSGALAPLTVGAIYTCTNCSGAQFVAPYTPATTYPVPTTLGGLQVTVDGTLAPLYFVSPGQIDFIVPNSARTSGFADLEVVQASTGQILGATQLPMAQTAPAAFFNPPTCNTPPVQPCQNFPAPNTSPAVTLYAAAVNEDGTINSATNPAIPGQWVALYMTGSGNVPGAPADGVPATAALPAPVPITVLLNGEDVNDYPGETNIQHILYSGIDGFPGMWQINLLIPQTVTTSSGVWFAVIANGVSNWNSASGFKTYIYVK